MVAELSVVIVVLVEIGVKVGGGIIPCLKISGIGGEVCSKGCEFGGEG